jgi:hypothetical protein
MNPKLRLNNIQALAIAAVVGIGVGIWVMREVVK